jgi:methylmalonyl-CoA/ethylmalonyl-CoA epimerase
MISMPDSPDELASLVDASFDHFALATPRIRDLLPLWIDAMGGSFRLGADNPEIGWRTVRLEFARAMCVELIEPLGGSTFLDTFLRRHPQGGVHHVTFLTDDVARAFAVLTERGYAPFGTDDTWRQLFVHPKQANGVLVQFLVRSTYTVPEMTLDEVLAGQGLYGTGVPSP